MSWWDASAISGLATQALKKAQKGIDKVLDINEEEGMIIVDAHVKDLNVEKKVL